jgi:hypothetical protein
MPASVDKYVGQRAELLADLVLTRRKEVQVFRVGAKDIGMDLVVRLMHPVANNQILPMFGVQVKGTAQPLEDERSATRLATQWVKARPMKGAFLFPVALLLFSMEDDTGYFGWLMEPRVAKGEEPALARPEFLEMKKITKKSVDEMLQRVVSWFEAMGKIVIKPEPAR